VSEAEILLIVDFDEWRALYNRKPPVLPTVLPEGRWPPVIMAHNAPLAQLATQLYTAAKEITQFCEQQDHPQRSFDRIEPATLLPVDAPQSVLFAQQSINEAATRIQQLVTDPNDFLARFQVQVSPNL